MNQFDPNRVPPHRHNDFMDVMLQIMQIVSIVFLMKFAGLI